MGIQWLLVSALIVIVFQAMIYRKWGQRGLSYSRQFQDISCYAGDETELIEMIANRKLLPIPWLRVESMIASGLHFGQQVNLDMSSGQLYQNHKSLFSLMPFMKIIRSHRVICEKRGYYRLSTAAMSVGDLLGLEAGTHTLATEAELYVYPQLLDLADLPIASHSFQGEVTVRRWIVDDPFLVSGVREYRYGDALNRVNWKATARSGRLQVQQHDYTADPRLVILVNVEVTEKMWAAVTEPELVERGLSIAATLAHEAVSRGIPVGFGFNGWASGGEKEPVHIDPEGGGEHLIYLMETMARLVLECTQPIAVFLESEVSRSSTHTDYVLISPYVSEPMRRLLNDLEDNGNSVEWIEIEREKGGKGGEPIAAS